MDNNACFDSNYKKPKNPNPIKTKKGWMVCQDNEDYYAKGWVHVMPINDKKEHKFCLECQCEPKIDFNICLAIHNSFDMRDIEEFVNKNI